MKKIELYTDGSCIGNPGPGGWCAIIKHQIHKAVFSDGKKMTTNNEMELMAVVAGISAIKEPSDITVYSDSKYVLDAIKSWLPNWVKNNWRTSTKKEVANKDLWQDYLKVSKGHKITCVWVKGHSGHPENEECDKIAFREATKQKN